MSGEKTQIGIEININAQGIEEVQKSLSIISGAMSLASASAGKMLDKFGDISIASASLNKIRKSLESLATQSVDTREQLGYLSKTLGDSSESYTSPTTKKTYQLEGLAVSAKKATDALKDTSLQVKSINPSGLDKTRNSADKAARSTSFLGKQIRLVRSYLEGIIAYRGLGLIAEKIGEAAGQANKLQEAYVRISLAGNRISQTQFSSIVSSQSERFGILPSEESEALFKAFQLGAKNATEAQNDLTSANQLSIITGQKLSDSLSTILEIYNVYASEGETVANVNDLLAKSALTSNANFEDYSKVLSEIVPIAKQAGISINEVFASFSTLASTGNLTSNQIYSLPSFFSKLISPTKQQIIAMNQLGISYGKAAIQAEGWGNYLKEIYQKTGGNKTLVAEILGDAPGQTANANVFFDFINNFMQTYEQNLAKMNSANGTAATAANALLQTNSKVFQQFGASFANLGANVASTIENDILPATKALTDLTTSLNNYITTSKQQSSPSTTSLSEGIVNAVSSGDYLSELKNLPDQIARVLNLGIKNVISGTITGRIYLENGNYIGSNGKEYDVNGNLVSKSKSKDKTSTASVPSNTSAPISQGNAVIPSQSNVQLDQTEDQNAQNLLADMKQQTATFGQTADAVMRYRTSLGDLKGAQQSVKDGLIKQSEILEYQQAFQSLSESFAQNFTAFATGSETAKEAFRSFASSTLEMLTELIIKMYAFKLVDAFVQTPQASGSASGINPAAFSNPTSPSGMFSSTNTASRVASLAARNSSNYGGGIVINAPVTVHAPGASGSDANKIAQSTSDSVTKNIRAVVQQEIVRQSKPGGLIAR